VYVYYYNIFRPYFEMKAQSNSLLEQQKTRVRALERQVAQSKLCYAKALGNLEKISDEIHQVSSHVKDYDYSLYKKAAFHINSV
jgi:hemoglobin-like flavoprotein